MARIGLEQLRANPPQADRTRIDATTEADIRRHATEDGQDPDAEPTGYRPVPAPAAIRRRIGATQQVFADVLGVPLATYRNWEQGRKDPDPAARSLLTIFDREPEAALRALTTDRGEGVFETSRGTRVHFADASEASDPRLLPSDPGETAAEAEP